MDMRNFRNKFKSVKCHKDNMMFRLVGNVQAANFLRYTPQTEATFQKSTMLQHKRSRTKERKIHLMSIMRIHTQSCLKNLPSLSHRIPMSLRYSGKAQLVATLARTDSATWNHLGELYTPKNYCTIKPNLHQGTGP